MADFYQTGLVPTLHSLRRDAAHQLDAELSHLGREKSIGLVLPALYSEFETPAMHGILEQLQRVPWLQRIVLVLSRADEEQYEQVRRLFQRLPVESTVLWLDSEPVQDFLRTTEEAGLRVQSPGKGQACWLGTGYLLAKGDCDVIAFQDCDIKTYHRHMLSRLVYPLVAEDCQFEFAKAFYPRFTAQLNGRVTRLFLTPLVRALQDAGIHSGFLRFLDSFRYGLAGEIAMTKSLARNLRVSPDWGLEVSTLSEVWQKVPVMRTCQVDLTDCYDHKHQVLSPADASRGLNKMTRDIAKALFTAVCRDGAVIQDELLKATLPHSYAKAAGEMVTRYAADASFNGLDYDLHSEEFSVEIFSESLASAGREFVENPMGVPALPSWLRMEHAVPEAFARLITAAERDPAWLQVATA
ncbi:hypothetical protein [uncultured Paludibaculum sp.]|uniref:hypothetical protein n=1 Tax=uncultured Paludibaculum sp. TaxID=1765020 RepID=UPI002AABB4BC|nr:hypothetical protein [uncultured Paludibaculum sp.]